MNARFLTSEFRFMAQSMAPNKKATFKGGFDVGLCLVNLALNRIALHCTPSGTTGVLCQTRN